MKKAYLFPGQGSQFPGMGKDLYDSNAEAKALFDQANDILGFSITEVMFNGTEEELKQTKVTQPAIFIHSVALAQVAENFAPDMVAGHSLGEFSALVAAKGMSFEDGLKLVSQRAQAMQRACEMNPSTMAAILGLDDDKVEEVAAGVEGTVVAANYNTPGQVVISGANEAIAAAMEAATAAGAKRAVELTVGGAFHSPLMEPAREELEAAILATNFSAPICPIYQNVTAKGETDVEVIKGNLVAQLTAPVRWSHSVQQMLADGAEEFVECGPGKVLMTMMRRIDRKAKSSHIEA